MKNMLAQIEYLRRVCRPSICDDCFVWNTAARGDLMSHILDWRGEGDRNEDRGQSSNSMVVVIATSGAHSLNTTRSRHTSILKL
jgi:hypothetical protein